MITDDVGVLVYGVKEDRTDGVVVLFLAFDVLVDFFATGILFQLTGAKFRPCSHTHVRLVFLLLRKIHTYWQEQEKTSNKNIN